MSKVHNLIPPEKHRTKTDLCKVDLRPPDEALVDLFLLLYEWNERVERADEAIQKNLQPQSH
jgi:hypothetical protein